MLSFKLAIVTENGLKQKVKNEYAKFVINMKPKL